jgi:ATP-grasp domain
LGRLWSYAKWRADELGRPTIPERSDGDSPLGELPAAGDGWLDASTAAAVLRAAGIAVPETVVVESAAEATRAARDIGYPVVVKRAGSRPLGRSVGAGVALDLTDAAGVATAFTTIHDVGGTGPIVVQPMQLPGFEVRLTVVQHRALGPILSVGPGGQAGGILGRHPQRLLPLSPGTIADLLAESRLTELFTVHGVDPEPLTDLIARLSDFATANEQVASIILDPVLVSATSCSVSDASVEVHPPTPDAALRQLDPR